MKIKNILFITLIIVVIGRLVVSYPLNENLIEGTDFTAHVPKILYLEKYYSNNGLWDPYWYGGYPIFKYYSPLSYYIAGFFTFFTDELISYKIVIDIFFLLAPLGFFILINDFRFNVKQKVVGLLTFSFFISNIYYFWNNAFPTVVNLLFCVLTWVPLKRYVENKSTKNFLFASLLIFFSILTHQLTAFLNLVLVFLWILIRYRKIPILPLLAGIGLSSFWLIPFLMEFRNPLFSIDHIFSFPEAAMHHIGLIGLSLFFVIFIVFILASLIKNIGRDFLLLILVILLIMFFSTYYRVMALLPIPLGLFIGKIYKKKLISHIIILVILIEIVFFFGYHPLSFQGHSVWEIPKVTNRVIYLPTPYDFCEGYPCSKFLYSAYLPLKDNQEIINGWFSQSQKIGELKYTKNEYLKMVNNPLNYSESKYHEILDAGFVNSVVVNKFYPQYVKYFSDSKYFKKVNETEHFVVFNTIPSSSYIEFNGRPINYTLERKFNEINIKTKCISGNLTIKESYDKDWKIFINDKEKNVKLNKYGFMTVKIDKNSLCNISLKFQRSDYIFLPISLITLVLLIFICSKTM